MDGSSISALFNRAILDTIVGFVFLGWCQIFGELVWGANPIGRFESSDLTRWAPLIFLVAGFLSGTLIDRFAFIAFDRRLFASAFQLRLASFDLPDAASIALDIQPEVVTNSAARKAGELVDDSRADIISAVFWTKARPEALTKRAELIANFQFDSNLLFTAVLYVLVLPAWLAVRRGEWIDAVIAALFLVALCLLLWRMSLAAIGRIHTHENLVVLGLIADGWRCTPIKSGSSSPRPSPRTLPSTRGTQSKSKIQRKTRATDQTN